MNAKASPGTERPPFRTLAVLMVLVMASAFAVIYAKHQSRKLFVELQALHKARDDMDIEWGQLQLEQSTLATHSRVEGTASNKLGMVIPDAKQVVILRP
ncbi:MAG: cell division protein FtsL [Gammaproteobacteria bacterium]|jgi:cell division protein FtsL